jgi:hypothetical protein
MDIVVPDFSSTAAIVTIRDAEHSDAMLFTARLLRSGKPE